MEYCQKKLLYDLVSTQPNDSGKRHGGGKYGEIVLMRLLELGYEPVCYYSGRKWLNPEIKSKLETHDISLIDIDKTTIDDIVEKERIDIIYSCQPSEVLINYDRCHVKGTLHGLRRIETPTDMIMWRHKNIRFKTRVKLTAEGLFSTIGIKWRKDDSFFKMFGSNPKFSFAVVSNHTAMALVSYYPQFMNVKIPVFYSPSTSSVIDIVETKYSEKYYLMVSGNRWEKNNLRAIIALDRLFSFGLLSGIRVKITGCNSPNIFRYKIKNLEKFDFMGYVDEKELEQLYHDAYCLIYPSLNEGFGYPPVEAMRYGVPVLASPFTSIPEVCQGAAIYFNPFSIEEIMNRILLVYSHPEIHKKYIEKSFSQFRIINERQIADLDGLINWIYE